MKTFNIISIIVFGVMALVTLVAGFYNPIHFLFCAFCVAMVTLAYKELKSEKEKKRKKC